MAVSTQIIATLAAASGGKIYATNTRSSLGEAGKTYLVITNGSSSYEIKDGPVRINSSLYIAIELAE